MEDQELLFIMERFTGLHTLSISDLSTVSWPTPKLSEAAMKRFLKWAFHIKTCHINLCGLSGEAWFMNLWYSSLDTVDERADGRCESSLSLELVNTYR